MVKSKYKHSSLYAHYYNELKEINTEEELEDLVDLVDNLYSLSNDFDIALDDLQKTNSWGLYKATNSTNLLNYSTDGKYTFNKVNNEVLTNTYKKYQSFSSTYSVQFSIRYIFN